MDAYKTEMAVLEEPGYFVCHADKAVVESRRYLMMRAFGLFWACLLMASIFSLAGGVLDEHIAAFAWLLCALAGIASLALMLAMTLLLHGASWVVINLIGAFVIPLYAPLAVLLLNGHAREYLYESD